MHQMRRLIELVDAPRPVLNLLTEDSMNDPVRIKLYDGLNHVTLRLQFDDMTQPSIDLWDALNPFRSKDKSLSPLIHEMQDRIDEAVTHFNGEVQEIGQMFAILMQGKLNEFSLQKEQIIKAILAKHQHG